MNKAIYCLEWKSNLDSTIISLCAITFFDLLYDSTRLGLDFLPESINITTDWLVDWREIDDCSFYWGTRQWAKGVGLSLLEAIPCEVDWQKVLRSFWIYKDFNAIMLEHIFPIALFIYKITSNGDDKLFAAE